MRKSLKRRIAIMTAGLFSLERRDKQILQVLADSCAVALSLVLAALLNRIPFNSHLIAEIALLTPFVVAVLATMGAYKELVRYTSFGISPHALAAALIAVSGLAVLHELIREQLLGRSLIDFGLILLLLISVPRQAVRWLFETSSSRHREQVAIFGAGAAGRELAMALRSNSKFGLCGFIDQDPALAGARILGLQVRGPEVLPQWVEQGVSHVLLAMPNISQSRRREIIASLEHLDIEVKTVPDMADLISGRAQVSELRNVDIGDLLGRDPVAPDVELINRDIRGKAVLVTGAGGSIGSELCRQILRHEPSALVLLDHSEHGLYEIERELHGLARRLNSTVPLYPVLGSVCDEARVQALLHRFGIQTCYHAAAYKHVPLVENNAIAALRNNVQGTWTMAQAAVEARIDSFVLVSTDKAVRPTNVMGASKRLAELGVQALAERGGHTRLSIVRFGNVLGSSGSVVPLFRSQIEAGGPVTVTHPEIIRYFMTIPEAAALVIQAGAMGHQGEVFVLDMGEPVNIRDLALRMIRLAGFHPRTPEHPEGDIEVQITGLRPGEKLYEELLIGQDAHGTAHPRIARSAEPALALGEFRELYESLLSACASGDMEALIQLLHAAPLAYQPLDDTAGDQVLAPRGSENVVQGGFRKQAG